MNKWIDRIEIKMKTGVENLRSKIGRRRQKLSGISENLQLGIKIGSLDTSKDIPEVAQLYSSVFAYHPWNEYTKCADCLAFSGKETHAGNQCPHCNNGILSLAYPQQETEDFIHEASLKPNAAMFIARSGDTPVGFAWGYEYSTR